MPGQGDLVFSTDSYVISPYFFPGGDIGKLSVCGTVNDISMCGGTPKYLSLGFILEEGLPVADPAAHRRFHRGDGEEMRRPGGHR